MIVKHVLFRVKSWIQYYVRAQTKFNVQSPFLDRWIREVFENRDNYYAFADIEKQRAALLKSHDEITKADFGAGSSYKQNTQKVKVSDIARRSLSTHRQCRWLCHQVRMQQPGYVLELGTSLGISTAYLASGSSKSIIYTLEGNPLITKTANRVFHDLKLQNIKTVIGSFSDKLPEVLAELPSLDLVFIDGHHEEKATLAYFVMILQKSTSDTVLIFDDINWSPGMKKAWEKIKSHPEVRLTVDVFDKGFVFLSPALSKENIMLIEFYKKPWRIGLFGK